MRPAVASLRLVLAQRLVRVVCDSCRMPYEPAAHEIEWLDKDLADMRGDDGAPMQKGTFFKGVGCNNCHQTGYRGRTGIYEMIEMTPEMTHAASQGDHITFNQIAQKQFANYTLKRDAIRLVLSGRTSRLPAVRALIEESAALPSHRVMPLRSMEWPAASATAARTRPPTSSLTASRSLLK